MATQSYDAVKNRFVLDLHGVLKRDAARVIRKRLEECSRYGIEAIEVIYGTPDIYDGSIASALHEVVTASPLVHAGLLPTEFVEDCEQFTSRIAKVTVPIRACDPHEVRDSNMSFAPFPASRESDPWRRRLCETAFSPLKRVFSRDEAARFIGRGCRAHDLPSEALTLDDVEGFCRSWTRPVQVEQPEMTTVAVPEPAPPSFIETWLQEWNLAAEEYAAGRFATAKEHLNRCLETSTESGDPRLLARTLAGLGSLLEASQQITQAAAYYQSARTAYKEAGEGSEGDQLEIESRLARTMLEEGRAASAAAMWSEVRERLESDPRCPPSARIGVYANEGFLRAQFADFDGALALLKKAIEIGDSDPDIEPSFTANLRLHSGLIESARGNLRTAMRFLTQAAEELADGTEQKFLCWREIAAVADRLGYTGRPEKILRQLCVPAQGLSERAEIARLETMIDLGILLFRQSRYPEAEAVYRDVLGASEGREWSAHMARPAHEDLGCVYTHTERFAEAEAEFRMAHEACAATLPPIHPLVANLIRNQAELYRRMGRLEEEREALAEAKRIYAACDGTSPEQAEAHLQYGCAFGRDGDLEEAEYHFRVAASIQDRIFGGEHFQVARPLVKLGATLGYRRAFTQARPVLQRAIGILEKWREPALLSEAYSAMAFSLLGMGNERGARKAQEKAKYFHWVASRGGAAS
jgi:tetratricopeptide (TPR) repeat protein